MSSSAPLNRSEFSPTRLVLLLLGWVGLIHATGFGGEFIFDDNALLQKESLRDLFGLEWFRLSSRPVAAATFAMNFTFFGESPLSFHVVSVAVHVAATACLYFLVRRSILLYRSTVDPQYAAITALIVAGLWGCHPLTTSAVVYTVQRSEALASLFIMLTLLTWGHAFGDQTDPVEGDASTKSRQLLWSILAIAFAYLAYGSKEISAGLILMVLLYDRVFVADHWRSIRGRWMWYLLLLLPLIVGSYLLLPSRIGSGGSGGVTSTIGFNLRGFTPWGYFTNQPFVFLQYLRLTVWPVTQSLDYGWLPSKSVLVQWLGFLLWVTILIGLVFAWRRSKAIAGCLGIALLVLAPTSSIMPLQDIIFEHRMYLPLACLIGAFVGWLALGSPTSQRQTGFSRWMLIGLLCVPLSMLTVRRNLQWWSDREIYESDVRNNPNNPRAIVGAAGTVEDNSTNPEPTLAALRKAIKISKDRDYFYSGTDYKWTRYLADILFLTGRPAEARPHYEEALAMSYNELQETEIYFQLAMIASMEGRNDDAEGLFQKTMQGHPQIQEKVQAVYAEHLRRLKPPNLPKQPAANETLQD